MSAPITIREYGYLTTKAVAEPSLALAYIESADLDWLCQQSRRFRVSHETPIAEEVENDAASDGMPLVKVLGRQTLRLDNYVGVIELPSGQIIEILPKTVADGDKPEQGRHLLRQMLACALDISPREMSEAALQGFDAPLSEWVMARFLDELKHLIKRGVRSDYRRIEGEERFLRGQLDLVRQMRQPPGRAHHFALRYDLYLPDRAENRLIRLALEQVAKATQQPENWRLSQEFRHLLAEVPVSRDVVGDFRQWRDDRLMAHYRGVRPWCELILYRIMPMALRGEWRGISLLFPMEKLFERYVERCLSQQLRPGATLRGQASSEYLCKHQTDKFFQLKPDLLLIHGEQRWVLDTKWKRLDSQNKTSQDKDSQDNKGKYGINQGDLYQMFAYGHKYLGGQGDLVLIYPAWEHFKTPLAPFFFDNEKQLRLWVLPFELGMDVEHRLLLPEPSAEDGAPLLLPLRATR